MRPNRNFDERLNRAKKPIDYLELVELTKRRKKKLDRKLNRAFKIVEHSELLRNNKHHLRKLDIEPPDERVKSIINEATKKQDDTIISKSKLRTLITRKMNKIMSYSYKSIHMLDKNYKLIDIDTLEMLICGFEKTRLEYKNKQYDCENFSISFYDYCVKATYNEDWGEAGIGVAVFGFFYTSPNGETGGHAINLVPIVDENENVEIVLVEPQSGEIMSFYDYLKTYTNLKLALLVM